MPVGEDRVLQKWARHWPRHDCHGLLLHLFFNTSPTCHQDKGSRIDYVFSPLTAYDLAAEYKVIAHKLFSTHSAVSVQLSVPQPAQVRRTLRSVATVPPLGHLIPLIGYCTLRFSLPLQVACRTQILVKLFPYGRCWLR